MQQPQTLTVHDNNFDPVEIVDMGDHVVLMQRDETGEANSIVLGGAALEELRSIATKQQAWRAQQ